MKKFEDPRRVKQSWPACNDHREREALREEAKCICCILLTDATPRSEHC